MSEIASSWRYGALRYWFLNTSERNCTVAVFSVAGYSCASQVTRFPKFAVDVGFALSIDDIPNLSSGKTFTTNQGGF